jgi:hypothetical protein
MALEELRANHLPHLRTLAVTCCPRLRYLQAAGLYRLERYSPLTRLFDPN